MKTPYEHPPPVKIYTLRSGTSTRHIMSLWNHSCFAYTSMKRRVRRFDHYPMCLSLLSWMKIKQTSTNLVLWLGSPAMFCTRLRMLSWSWALLEHSQRASAVRLPSSRRPIYGMYFSGWSYDNPWNSQVTVFVVLWNHVCKSNFKPASNHREHKIMGRLGLTAP